MNTRQLLQRRTVPPLRQATSALRVLPDFLIIGGRCCGTTSLHAWLKEHPGVFLADPKEVHFFDDHYDLGLTWYRSHFPTAAWCAARRRVSGARPVVGEVSPFYLYHPPVPARVHEAMPDVRLIALLRNPADRAFSQYQQSRRYRIEPLSFEKALEAEEERLRSPAPAGQWDPHFNEKHYSYRSRGFYHQQLARWLQLFPADQLLVLNSDLLFRQPERQLPRVRKFLGLSDTAELRFPRVNAGRYRDQISPATRARLVEEFQPANAQLSQLLDERFDWD